MEYIFFFHRGYRKYIWLRSFKAVRAFLNGQFKKGGGKPFLNIKTPDERLLC